MKITIFGASGGTGAQVTRQALDAGYEVTAVARHPERITLHHERLEIVRGDALEAASVEAAIAGRDAVVSCLGATARERPVTLYSAGMRNILQAMRKYEVRRLLCISANPVEIGNGDALIDRVVLKPLVRAIFGASYADMARMEDEVRSSGLEWTIMRPPRLTNRPRTDHYRTAINRNLPHGRFISRADLASAMLRELGDPAASHAAVTVAY